MAFLTDEQIGEFKQKIVTDSSILGKLYYSKKKEYIEQNVEHNELEKYLSEGWMKVKELKTKWKIQKNKSHSKLFEDRVWCQFYELGYRILNRDETLKLPFGNNPDDKKQIDVLAVDKETAFIIECKSAEKLKKAPSYNDDFDALRLRIEGFRQSIREIYGKDLKVKYIFATNNIRLSEDGEDKKRLDNMGVFYYNNNTYDYVESLIKHYEKAAKFQFLGLVFKNEAINKERIEIPAVEGRMGGELYYMFSIEPELLLKIGFVLHRTKANNSEMPTYQRLLIPNRIKNITKFIDEGGYFPNSLIINFSEGKKIQFEADRRGENTNSRAGILKIPNEYAIAYIMDGQHRLYGYANSQFLSTNTVPVVAMNGLEPAKQLKIFMDINQYQKAVSASLKGVLAEDLFWNDKLAEYRQIGLRSSIVKTLSIGSGPLCDKITIGEDNALLSFDPFEKALRHSGLLPTAKGDQYKAGTTDSALYNVNNTNIPDEMGKSKKRVVEFLNLCYSFVEDNYFKVFDDDKYFVVSNRGTYPFIVLIGDIHKYLVTKDLVNINSSSQERFNEIQPYLKALLDKLLDLPEEVSSKYLIIRGQGSENAWLRFFQSIVNEKYSQYAPIELVDWKERQNEEIQNQGRMYGEKIERYMKTIIISNLKQIYGEEWFLEITNIMIECQKRANLENEKNKKEGIDKRTDWTEMFNINDYKEIIEKHWSKKPDGDRDFKTFENIFSIDMDFGFNSKAEKIKWISHFNSYRNLWAHAGTKEKRLNKQEVEFLEKIYKHFYPSDN